MNMTLGMLLLLLPFLAAAGLIWFMAGGKKAEDGAPEGESPEHSEGIQQADSD